MKSAKSVLALTLATILLLLSACSAGQAPPVPVAPVWQSNTSGGTASENTPAPAPAPAHGGDGTLVGLPYQATGGAYIYRRSIAIDVWGTDDPEVIKDKVGPGRDKFLEAAEELKAKDYAIVSGDGDI